MPFPDQFGHAPNDFVDLHAGRIEDGCIRCRSGWRDRPFPVPLVACLEVAKKTGEVNTFSFFFQLFIAAMCAFLDAGFEEDLGGRIAAINS